MSLETVKPTEKSTDPIKKKDDDLQRVMNEDGIKKVQIFDTLNQLRFRLAEIKQEMGEAPWSRRIVYNERMSAVLICQKPGQGNRTHYHEVEDEWWVIMEGELEWDVSAIGGSEIKTVRAAKDDIVFVPRKLVHTIRVVGDRPSIRLAIGKPDVEHVFV